MRRKSCENTTGMVGGLPTNRVGLPDEHGEAGVVTDLFSEFEPH